MIFPESKWRSLNAVLKDSLAASIGVLPILHGEGSVEPRPNILLCLGEMLKRIAAAGQIENTLVLIASDNGMPFPRAKANL